MYLEQLCVNCTQTSTIQNLRNAFRHVPQMLAGILLSLLCPLYWVT